jgi:hypothetical protein
MNKDELQEFVRTEMREALQGVLREAVPSPDGDKGAGGQAFDIMQILELAETKDDMVAEFKQYFIDQHEAMQHEAKREAVRQIALVRRESHIAELCHKVIGGTDDNPRGIPANENDLKEFLMRLPEADLEFAQRLLRDIHEKGLHEFTELGHGRQLRNLQKVPAEIAPLLKDALDKGATAEEFFTAAEMGSADQYDLSAFEGGK